VRRAAPVGLFEKAAPSGRWDVRAVRGRLRLVSALVMLAFVVCHLVSQITLLVSFPVANRALPEV
jgi:hypothetical protein